jgi:hypothetical protein
MLEKRTFHVVVVKGGHGSGIAGSESADRIVGYTGEKVSIKL